MEFQNLQSLLNRATAPSSEEEAKHYCTRFTTLVNQEPDGASRAITILIGKVQSQSEPVALRAIHVLDQCAKNCGKNFQNQIGKFKFLNELIKLVSPKYSGNQTPPAVRSALVQQIKLWSQTYKDQPKITEAFSMLDRTGNTNIKVVEKEFEYAAGEDADKAALLAQLLKSKNKKDLEVANKMIKDMVAAEGRKIEQDAELLKDVDLIHNNGRLLSEMLGNTNKTEEEKILLDELHKTCVGLRPKLYRLAGQLSDSAQLSSVVEAGETLNKAIELYEMTVAGPPPQITGYQPPNVNSPKSVPAPPDRESTELINLEEEKRGGEESKSKEESMSAVEFDNFLQAVTTGTAPPPTAPNENLASTSGLFGGMEIKTQTVEVKNNNDFDSALGLFNDSSSGPSTNPQNSNNLLDDLFSSGGNNATVLEPIRPVTETASPQIPDSNPKDSDKTQDAFDLLIPGFGGQKTFEPQKPKPKPTLSELSNQNKTSGLEGMGLIDTSLPPASSASDVPASNAAFFDTSLFDECKAPVVTTTTSDINTSNGIDDIFSAFVEPAPAPASVPVVAPAVGPTPVGASVGGLLSGMKITQPPTETLPPVKNILDDVSVPLTLIKPSPEPPTVLYDSPCVRVSLYRTQNKPNASVNVWLITITNSSATTVEVLLSTMDCNSGTFNLTYNSEKASGTFVLPK